MIVVSTKCADDRSNDKEDKLPGHISIIEVFLHEISVLFGSPFPFSFPRLSSLLWVLTLGRKIPCCVLFSILLLPKVKDICIFLKVFSSFVDSSVLFPFRV